MDDTGVFEVEEILDHKKTRNGRYQYLIKWIDVDEPTWESQDNLQLVKNIFNQNSKLTTGLSSELFLIYLDYSMKAPKMIPNLVFIDYDPCVAARVYDNSTLVADIATPKPRQTSVCSIQLPKPKPSAERITYPLELHLRLQK
jgi:hypothetical protein